jgi:hypothetical protein
MSAADVRQVLETITAAGQASAGDLETIARSSDDVLDDALASFAADRGADALPALAVLTADRAGRGVRRAAKRALYRLAQRGIVPAPTPGRRVVERQPERAVRGWISAIDGSGSRAIWVLFESAYGGLKLCSLIVNDEVGVVEVAGGDITKKRLDRELHALRAEQKLPWVEVPAARVLGIVVEALGRHEALGTVPPGDFARWRPLIESAPRGEAAPAGALPETAVDESALARATELLELPDMAGWFLDPDSVQADALEILQTRESRLVVSDQIKAEREDAILARVIERAFTSDARARWARRLSEMAWIFDATDRPESARLARAAGAALADAGRDVTQHPMARAMARRALELAAEVTLGRVNAADVSRKPTPTREPSPPSSA